MSAQGYVSPRGLLVGLEVISEGWVDHVDARYVTLNVTTSSTSSEVQVRFPTPPIINHNATEYFGRPFDPAFARELAVVAVLIALDRDPDVGVTSHTVVFDADDLYGLLGRDKLNDAELRRYMARRLYSCYTTDTLHGLVNFDDMDKLITGNSTLDFLRCVQMLDAEGYARAHLTFDPDEMPGAQPTAKLVREVERWGGPKDDVTPNADYQVQLSLYPALGRHADSLVRERHRFLAATSIDELESVFRATAPIIEEIARDLVKTLGSTRDLPTLGPIISEMQARGIGGVALRAQLNHILKFGRDLAGHGHAVSEPVLRIACENAFDLAPRLGSLYPR